MAATYKLSISLLLLVIATTTLVGLRTANNVEGGKICPQYCLAVEYMTCGSSYKKLKPSCNCCMAPDGCTLHLADGTSRYCSGSGTGN